MIILGFTVFYLLFEYILFYATHRWAWLLHETLAHAKLVGCGTLRVDINPTISNRKRKEKKKT